MHKYTKAVGTAIVTGLLLTSVQAATAWSSPAQGTSANALAAGATVHYEFIGRSETVTIPAGAQVEITATGAGGGKAQCPERTNPGRGATLEGLLKPSDTQRQLTLAVGGAGKAADGDRHPGDGGWGNGLEGGRGGQGQGGGSDAGGGGGATSIKDSAGRVLVVAAGGGGVGGFGGSANGRGCGGNGGRAGASAGQRGGGPGEQGAGGGKEGTATASGGGVNGGQGKYGGGGGGGGGGSLNGAGSSGGWGNFINNEAGGGGGAGNSLVDRDAFIAYQTFDDPSSTGDGQITFTYSYPQLKDETAYRIHWSGRANRSIDIPNNTSNVTYLQTYENNNTSAQRWTASSANREGFRQLKTVHGMCLTAAAEDRPGGEVTQSPCAGAGAMEQWWKYEYGVLSAENGLSLDVDPSTEHLISTKPDLSDRQLWGLEAVS
ncbi:RICIN domain-containing protein [Streptomyces sp. NPDC008343]|uniref:RICIN domain-containing protein n=1 Tax=Streptomyces sp. NPDC008343 TaxID=3364828 RepID=UPI0036EC5C69